MGVCIFCGDSETSLTREHVRADWLKRYIPKNRVNYTAGRVSVNRPGIPNVVSEKKIGGDPLSRRVKCVCEACNIGWMKHIQDAAKPIIVPMLKGGPATLQRKQQRVLAAWVAMSVMCSEFDKNSLQAISHEDRDILYRHKVPPRVNWRIWIGRHDGPAAANSQWDHRALLILPAEKVADAATSDGRSYNTQSTTYAVGELFVHAISADWEKCVRKFRMVHSDALIELWPPNGSPLRWPPSHTLSDAEAGRVAAGFFEGLRRAGTR